MQVGVAETRHDRAILLVFSALRVFALTRQNYALSAFVFLLGAVSLGVNFVGLFDRTGFTLS